MNAARHPQEAMRSDDWLSAVMGLSAFSLQPPYERVSEAALAAAAGGKPAFFYCKVPVAEAGQVARLTGCGFRVVDTQLTFERGVEAPATSARREVALAGPMEHAAVLDIAGTCFRYSRFHLDPHLPQPVAHAIKRAWAQSYVERRRGEELLVVHDDAGPAGFLAVLLAREAPGPVAVIDLVGVASGRQGRGSGAALVDAFCARWGGRAKLLRVGTQVANTPSVRLYERCGFRLAAASYVLHAHVREGKVLA
jgi:GNAT superfamily N-acetyltransferase